MHATVHFTSHFRLMTNSTHDQIFKTETVHKLGRVSSSRLLCPFQNCDHCGGKYDQFHHHVSSHVEAISPCTQISSN